MFADYSVWMKTAILTSREISFRLQIQAEMTGILHTSGLYLTLSIKDSVVENNLITSWLADGYLFITCCCSVQLIRVKVKHFPPQS